MFNPLHTGTDQCLDLLGCLCRAPSQAAHLDADGNDVAPLIDLPSKGSNGTDELDLAPGEYRIICEIPGHSGTMNAKLTITP